VRVDAGSALEVVGVSGGCATVGVRGTVDM
jgi:hypothetical protein